MLDKLLNKFNIVGLDLDKVYEIRIRENAPIKYFIEGRGYVYENVKFNKSGIFKIVTEITQNSYYSFEDQFAKGFLNYHGAKIALGGEGVYENGKLKTLKNFSSVVIRVPKDRNVVDKKTAESLQNHSVCIVGKTACGKTTFLRDLIKQLPLNSVVVDERGELRLSDDSLGENAEILTYVDKVTAVELAVRGLNPDVIAFDEVFSEREAAAISLAKRAGVRVIATFHGEDENAVKNSFLQGIFDKAVILEKVRGNCGIERIVDL